jgi:hypothetical protein
MRVADEIGDRDRFVTLNRTDFAEALCRVAEWYPLPDAQVGQGIF